MIGRIFGKLTVLSEHGRDKRKSILWKCLCGCGCITTATTYDLNSGHKKSCGCIRTGPKPKSLVGKIFARLKVKKRSHTDKWRATHWLCICRCGEETIVSGPNLSSGATKSCGCLTKELGIEKLSQWRKKQKPLTEKERKYNKKLYGILTKYGMTKLEYENMLKLQDNKCDICNTNCELVVDHDHTSGIVRGLLCNNCNRGLGSFKDNPKFIKSAIFYLEKICPQ